MRDGEGQRVVGSLCEGEYFGEIGLLRSVPRTATVTAVIGVRAPADPGDRFLAIVTGEVLTYQHPVSHSTGTIDRTERDRAPPAWTACDG